MRQVADNVQTKSICFHCRGEYDGEGLKVGQKIQCPHCRQALPHNVKFGDYLLLRKIGEGGRCCVYLAHDVQHDRDVALKILHDDQSEDEEFVTTLMGEAVSTATLRHPNIIQTYDFGEADGRHFLSMEHLSGGSLDDRLVTRGQLPEIECIEVALSAARGLQHAAERGIIHRDVKPGNILFDSIGTAKLADFGLSLNEEAPNPNTGEIWGTAYYVPPERVNGEKEDFRSDIYGLGASLFHALTGRAPFDDASPDATANHHCQGDKIRARDLNSKLSEKTSDLVAKAMELLPENRFQSYDALIKALTEVKNDLIKKGHQLPASTPAYSFLTHLLNRKTLLILAAIFLIDALVLIGLLIRGIIQRSHTHHSAHIEQVEQSVVINP